MFKENFKIVTKTMAGLEEVLAEEIKELGGQEIQPGRREVTCDGNLELVYRMNYEARTALRVMVPILEWKALFEEEFYNQALKMPWEKYLSLKQTFAINATVRSPFFKHEKYISLKLKDAICDAFREKHGERPNVDPIDPDVRFNLFINRDRVIVSLDTSGDSLHKRGYRNAVALAPINEVLAAGMIKLSGWDGKKDFYDTMCGSGTLPIEAGMAACQIPAQYYRAEFGFLNWTNFDADLWKKVQKNADEKIIKQEGNIYGSDKVGSNVSIAEKNAERFEEFFKLEFFQQEFMAMKPKSDEGILIMNPPYDMRIEHEDINEFYRQIGDSFKANWSGHTAWMISSNFEAFKNVGLRPSRKIPLFNGPLECKFQKYEMYSGSKRTKFQNRAETGFRAEKKESEAERPVISKPNTDQPAPPAIPKKARQLSKPSESTEPKQAETFPKPAQQEKPATKPPKKDNGRFRTLKPK